MSYTHLIVQSTDSIISVLKYMDSVKHKMLLVYKNGVFFTIVTIGDLQRAIINNFDLNTSIEQIINIHEKQYVLKTASKESIINHMLKIRCEFMPVIDEEGNLVDVYFWSDLFHGELTDETKPKINLPVVIMAGGKGTRLKPITNVIPKPLVPIGDKTILETILNQFESIGCTKFYMSVNYKSDMMKYYIDHLEHHYDIEYFEEPKPLGTIGSVSLLKNKITTPFFVSNCDITIEQDYRDVYDYHCSNKNALTIVTAVKSFKIPYGVIETGTDGLMTGLKEKPEITYMINTGVYILNPECIDMIPQNEFFHITHLMEKLKTNGERVGCFPVSENAWKDMGDWPEYLKMINVR